MLFTVSFKVYDALVSRLLQIQMPNVSVCFRQIVIPLKQHYIVLCTEVKLDGLTAASTTFR